MQNNKTKIVVFTGSGISAESGISTFRDAGGLWENHKVEDVATADAWERNPELILKFYNARRKQLLESRPNVAHTLIAELEDIYDVSVITQNVDDLHERAGSTNVLHLHGELTKCRSSKNNKLIYDIGEDLQMGQRAEDGSQLRPHIVFFGEDVPNMTPAMEITKTADIFVVIGTSLVVYPAASLLYYVRQDAAVTLIDPNPPTNLSQNINVIPKKATEGVTDFVEQLKNAK
ncbi:MAG: NAD-dependent deacylase [Ignavibacteria bacterium]|jgi:NAD-dependent deacetylase|nr:NAD-dependent deacylase [Ignavibacteria bacterium]